MIVSALPHSSIQWTAPFAAARAEAYVRAGHDDAPDAISWATERVGEDVYAAGILLRARGHERWRFALRTRLPRGNYRIDVRAVDITGNKETPNKRRNIVRFRVR